MTSVQLKKELAGLCVEFQKNCNEEKGTLKFTLTELDGGRCRLEATSLVDSFAARDAFLASGMETGVREGYERLDELVARRG